MVHSKTKHPSAPAANALVSLDRFGCRAPCHAEALRGGGSHFAEAGRLREICYPLLPNSYFLLSYRLRLGSHHEDLTVRSVIFLHAICEINHLPIWRPARRGAA